LNFGIDVVASLGKKLQRKDIPAKANIFCLDNQQRRYGKNKGEAILFSMNILLKPFVNLQTQIHFYHPQLLPALRLLL